MVKGCGNDMEHFYREISKLEKIDNHVADSKFLSELKEKINQLRRKIEDLEKSYCKCQLKLSMGKQKISAEELSSMETKVQILVRATNLKFLTADSGVMMHHGKACNFSIPANKSKQQITESLWKDLESSTIT